MRGKVPVEVAGSNFRRFIYRLFPLADLVCTLNMISLKLNSGMKMSRSETKFFGGPKAFKHNILRRIKAREILP